MLEEDFHRSVASVELTAERGIHVLSEKVEHIASPTGVIFYC